MSCARQPSTPDTASLDRFFRDLPATIDHDGDCRPALLRASYGRLVDMDFAQVRNAINGQLMLALQVARNVMNRVRLGGTLLFMGGTDARPGIGLAIASALTTAIPALTATLALELAAVRRQPSRCGLRRHTLVGIAARR